MHAAVLDGARLCAKRQSQRGENTAAGFQHSRAPPSQDIAARFNFLMSSLVILSIACSTRITGCGWF